MNITEDELLEINRRWKAVRAKARDEGCTEAERRAFALKAKEIKSEVHERLQGKETDEVLFCGAREPARTKPAMIDWIGKWFAADAFVLFLFWSLAMFALMCLIVKLDETIWGIVRALQ